MEKNFCPISRSFWSATRPRIAFRSNAVTSESGARTPRTPKALRAKAFFDWYEFVWFVGNKILSIHETEAFRLHAVVQDAELRAVQSRHERRGSISSARVAG